jgi:polyferredoxin
MPRGHWLSFIIIAVSSALLCLAVALLAHFPYLKVMLYAWLPFAALMLIMHRFGARPFRISQVISAILINSYVLVFFQTRELVYTGVLKNIPQPILNCYFGPLSVFGCPIGTFQQMLGLHLLPWMAIGFFVIIGVVVGRMACGWVCTFGLWQDLLNKIPVGPQAGGKRWVSFAALTGFAAVLGIVLALWLKVSWWRYFLFAWLPFVLIVLYAVLRGKRDIPKQMYLGGWLAAVLLGVLVWAKFDQALGITIGATGMVLLGLTGRWFAAVVAALAGFLFALLGPSFHIGPLSGLLLAATVAVTLAALVLLLDRVIGLRLPSTLLKWGFLVTLAGIVSWKTGSPWFCKLCPQGALEAGIPQVLWDVKHILREQVFWIFWVKVGILVMAFTAAIAIRRPFCRLICPIGAVYSPFNKASLLHLKVDETCKQCRICERVCPMDIEVHEGANQLECIRCLECKYACNPDKVEVRV